MLCLKTLSVVLSFFLLVWTQTLTRILILLKATQTSLVSTVKKLIKTLRKTEKHLTNFNPIPLDTTIRVLSQGCLILWKTKSLKVISLSKFPEICSERFLKMSSFESSVDAIKPWPNGASSRRKLKTWVYLRLRLAMAWVHLRWLAMTCAHFGRDQICTQVKASFSPFGHTTQVNTNWVTSINLLLANEIEESRP